MSNKFNNKLVYLTYQSFPAETANSLQTITSIVEMVNQDVDIELVFPDREKTSSDDIQELKSYYNFDVDFKVKKLKHNLPFGKFKKFKKTSYHISHFIWAMKSVNQISNNISNIIFITRSDWVLYFLAKKNLKVLFECHQPSKLRNLILKYALRKSSTKIIFLNENLYEYHKKYIVYKNNSIILGSAYKDEFFQDKIEKIPNQVVFAGQLLRFGSDRNINFLVSCFEEKELEKFELKIIGGPSEYIEIFKNKRKKPIPKNVEFIGRIDHKNTTKMLLQSEIGILINNEDNHALKYTSPLKYFEYLAANLKIVAVDFNSHKKLPFSDNILFFQNNQKVSFINSIVNSKKTIPVKSEHYEEYSLSKRIKKIIKFARLEGLEPPTL
tara:strand:- start:1936 stop:3084 length:1149 start_codon:yes stop_codon:yes gene_type:complete